MKKRLFVLCLLMCCAFRAQGEAKDEVQGEAKGEVQGEAKV